MSCGVCYPARAIGAGMKKYFVKEIFQSLQGEGYWSGRLAVFVRFAGCNLWSGRERDREKAICKFCDTDFVGGKSMSQDELISEICKYSGMVIFTGGEPALQLDNELIRQLHKRHKYCAIETNGTLKVPETLDWICVSPKAGTEIIVKWADELKFVFPQGGMSPDAARNSLSAKHLWLSPMDGPSLAENIKKAIDYVHADNRWRLNIQAHKIWEIR